MIANITFKGKTEIWNNTSGSFSFPYPCSLSTECEPYVVFLESGFYLLEVWGASGGDNGDDMGGPGGYSSGVLRLTSTTKIYVYVGGKGIIATQAYNKGGYNGGGFSMEPHNKDSEFGTGGGSTDIRIKEDNLFARVIVAGGGGGYGKYMPNKQVYTNKGGYGGGLFGGNGTSVYLPNREGRGGSVQIP